MYNFIYLNGLLIKLVWMVAYKDKLYQNFKNPVIKNIFEAIKTYTFCFELLFFKCIIIILSPRGVL